MTEQGLLRKVKGWILRKTSQLRRRLAIWNVQISSLLINLVLLLMLALSGVLVAMAMSQIRLTTGTLPPDSVASLSQWLLGLFVEGEKLKVMADTDRASVLGTLVSAIGAIVTAVFAVVAWLIARVENNARSRHAPISNLPVYGSDGIDDVSVMMEEYEHANSIVVFGGDFSWMREDANAPPQVQSMRTLVSKLAASKKIRLISYKDDAVASGSIGAKMRESIGPNIVFNPKLNGLRASFINSPFGRVLIYKVHADRHEMHICRVTDRTKDGKELLDQFSLMIATL
jgi:hypothetical protein